MLLRESCRGNNIQIFLFNERFELDLYFKPKKIWQTLKKAKRLCFNKGASVKGII